MTEELWIGPTVESQIDELAQSGHRHVVIAPIGFVSDHVEILYDIDIHFRNYALERGLTLSRPDSLNSSPALISALAALVEERIACALLRL
jgi:ferrochelatase